MAGKVSPGRRRIAGTGRSKEFPRMNRGEGGTGDKPGPPTPHPLRVHDLHYNTEAFNRGENDRANPGRIS
jgi:hypothetical protein